MTREETERQAAHMRRNLALDLHGRGHRLAALLVAGVVELGGSNLPGDAGRIDPLTEDQAAAALEAGQSVVMWRATPA